MPTFNNISNGESGLSVRTTLNDVINYVNTGITSGTSFTYITEDTTPGSEFVNILSPKDIYMSGTSITLDYYGAPTTERSIIIDGMQMALNNGDGTNDTNLVFGTSQVVLSSTDGTFNNTSTIDSDRTLYQITDGTITMDADFDANNGGSLSHSDGTNFATIGFDAFTGNVTLGSTDGGTNTLTQTNSYNNGFLVEHENVTLGDTNNLLVKQTLGIVVEIDNLTPLPILGYSSSTFTFSAATTTGIGTGLVVDITFDASGDLDSYSVINGGSNYLINDSVTTNNLGSGSITFDIVLTDKSNIEMNVNLGSLTTNILNSAGSVSTATGDGSSYTNATQTYTGFAISSSQGGSSSSIGLTNYGLMNLTSTDGTWTNTTTIDSDRSVNEITDGTLYGKIDLDVNNNGIVFEITGGSSTNTLTFLPDWMIWDNNYVTGDTRVGLEFDPSGGLGETRFYKENYVTNEISGIFIPSTNQVQLKYTSSAATVNYIDVNSLGIDSQVINGNTQFQSTNNISSNTLTLEPTSTSLLSTDGSYSTGLDVSVDFIGLYSNDNLSTNNYTSNIDIQYDSITNIPSVIVGVNGTSASTVSRVSTSIDLDTQTPTLVLEAQDDTNGTIVSLGLITVNIKTLPVYADNSAAITGGLIAGDLYRTSTGVVMIRY